MQMKDEEALEKEKEKVILCWNDSFVFFFSLMLPIVAVVVTVVVSIVAGRRSARVCPPNTWITTGKSSIIS